MWVGVVAIRFFSRASKAKGSPTLILTVRELGERSMQFYACNCNFTHLPLIHLQSENKYTQIWCVPAMAINSTLVALESVGKQTEHNIKCQLSKIRAPINLLKDLVSTCLYHLQLSLMGSAAVINTSHQHPQATASHPPAAVQHLQLLLSAPTNLDCVPLQHPKGN